MDITVLHRLPLLVHVCNEYVAVIRRSNIVAAACATGQRQRDTLLQNIALNLEAWTIQVPS
jgi:hypothetical protein